MARFVESAELRVLDNSTAPLRRINSELRKLGATARKVQGDLARLSMPALKASGAGSMAATLRKHATEARGAERAMTGLASSYRSAAAAADRLAVAAARANSQMSRLNSTSRASARIAGAIEAGGARGGGRRSHSEGGYAPHIYANPTHALANHAAGAAFGRDLSLGQALTITAAGAVTIHAAHVALEGAKERSTAEEKLFQRGLSPDDVKWARGLAARISTKYKTTSIADNLETLNDIGAAVHDRAGQSQLLELLARRQQLTGAQGQDARQVRESNARIVKALEVSGSLVDSHGHFNAERVDAMMTMIQGVESIEGRNIDARQIQQAFKYLRENALTQSIPNIRNALFLAAEIGGSSSGTALNQAIRNLTGSASKRALASAVELGLGTATYGPRGKLEKYQVKDEELLRSDFGGWIEKNLMPKVEAAGIDPKADAAALSKFLGKIVSDRTAKDALMKWITQHAESVNKARAAENVRQDEKTAEGATYRDINSAFSALTKQTENVGGSIFKRFGNILIWPTNAAANVMNDLEKVISGTATQAEKDHVTKAGVGAAVAGVGALWAGAKLLGALSPLNASAVALNSSAAALTGAAAALSGAAGVGGAGGVVQGLAAGAASRGVWAIAGRLFGAAAGAYLIERLGEAWLENLSPETGKKVRTMRETLESELAANAVDAITVLSGGTLAPIKALQLTEAQRLRKLNEEATGLQKRLRELGDLYAKDKIGNAHKAIEIETANIVARLNRLASSISAATSRIALRNFGPAVRSASGQLGYGAAGAGAAVGTPGGPTIPRGGFLGGSTFEATLATFAQTLPATITGLKESTSQFENATRQVKEQITAGAEELAVKGAGLSAGWQAAFKSGGDTIAASIRSALAGGVQVQVQQSAPSTGPASPSKQ